MLRNLLHRLRRHQEPARSTAHQPGAPQPSPVPWVSDEIWTSWAVGGSDQKYPALRDPRLYVVSRDDLRRAPIAAVEIGAKVPPWTTFSANQQQLQELTLDSGGVLDPSWPMCCGRLATLVNQEGYGRSIGSIEAETGSLDLAFMEMEIWHDWSPRDQEELDLAFATGYEDLFKELGRDDALQGILLFQCRACGRIYVGSCTP